MLGEIRKGVMRLDWGKRRRRLELWLEQDLPLRFEGRVLTVDREVADRWGTLSAVTAALGTSLPVIDRLLDATVLHHNLTLVTRNTADVDATDVHVLNSWLPGKYLRAAKADGIWSSESSGPPRHRSRLSSGVTSALSTSKDPLWCRLGGIASGLSVIRLQSRKS